MANFNFNKAIIGGRLTAEPELRQTQSGTPVTQVTVAVSRPKAKDGTQAADFINVVAWKTTAELICRYFHKGSSICITGRIQTRSFNDRNGEKRYVTEVIADEVTFVDSKADNAQSGAPAAASGSAAPEFPEFTAVDEDDLPF